MGILIDLSDREFNYLTIIKRAASSKAGAKWTCRCRCGNFTDVDSLKLRNGLTKSCGCYRAGLKTNLKHGMANKTKTYKTWKQMRQRCNNVRSTQYKWYGGKGIKICKRWDDFGSFLADMGERPENKTIDRIDGIGDYEPMNCRWASAKEQAETNSGCFQKGSIPHNKGITK